MKKEQEMRKQMLLLNESTVSKRSLSRNSMSKSSKMGKRSKSLSNVKTNKGLPEIKIDSKEPKTKQIDWQKILRNPFKLREMPKTESLNNVMLLKKHQEIF